ncbi:D-glycero-beta-D-manno-heptose 1-phosphate adenylyltransferase [Mucilaginibacter sp.]|uniref:D-glycero-beta-D-manno-heptose 1-phosphate adenylyltransferase n=1 Tax=Mucilaginibacter sp. TaxID=1882438 RepID=UPI00260AACA8|nr:D-glycero-beta-D-manno-heptose 1-phosphate adenylyltransferase [Mucilaginibacter sp.]MDB4919455.1 rfaE2 [Mucilaginibacter sp.]
MRVEIEKLIKDKIIDQRNIKNQILIWRSNGNKVTFTNGVFDLLHIGHITYLAKAAELGDKLIIGLNSDSSVRRLKGRNRPINDQNSRATLLAALFFVDGVVIFEEDTPLNLISSVLPDILVKGADYSPSDIVGSSEVLANGGEVKTINFIEGCSSTSIIEKIKKLSL